MRTVEVTAAAGVETTLTASAASTLTPSPPTIGCQRLIVGVHHVDRVIRARLRARLRRHQRQTRRQSQRGANQRSDRSPLPSR